MFICWCLTVWNLISKWMWMQGFLLFVCLINFIPQFYLPLYLRKLDKKQQYGTTMPDSSKHN